MRPCLRAPECLDRDSGTKSSSFGLDHGSFEAAVGRRGHAFWPCAFTGLYQPMQTARRGPEIEFLLQALARGFGHAEGLLRGQEHSPDGLRERAWVGGLHEQA